MSTNNLTTDRFTFDDVQGNLNTIMQSYTDYGGNTTTANECVATYVNNGDGSGINSAAVGSWFSAIWAANTTYAEQFKEKFAEWSQVVTNVMKDTGDMDEEAQSIYNDLNGIAELNYTFYNYNSSIFKGTNARLMIDAKSIYNSFAYNWFKASSDKNVKFDPTEMENFLKSDPTAKNYITDKAVADVQAMVAREEENIVSSMMRGGVVDYEKGVHVPTVGLSPVAREVAEYYNEHQKMPTAEDLKIFDSTDWSKFDPHNIRQEMK